VTYRGYHGERTATVYLDYWLVGVTNAKGWTFTLDDKPAHHWTGEGDDMWDESDDAKAAAEAHVQHAMAWEEVE
jgi:hypothetical protein